MCQGHQFQIVLYIFKFIFIIEKSKAMRKKNIDFQSQMKNSQQFLSKLQGFQKTSKQIKDKNKLTAHRNIWVKQYKYLARLDRDCQLQLGHYLQDFDSYFQYEYQQKQIFGQNNFKNYSELKNSFDQQFQTYSVTTWSQVQSLPILFNKIKKSKSKDINLQEIKNIMHGIGQFLNQVGQQHEFKMTQLNKSTLYQRNEANEQQDFQDIVFDMKPIFDEVRGFDFQKQRLKQIQQGEKNLIQYLESMADKLSQDQISQVIEEFHQASNLLQQSLQLQIEKIGLDYEDALSLDSEINSLSENFQKINHFYQIYLGRGKSVSQYYERLTIQFPKISRKILQRITSYIEAKIYKDRKIKTAKRNYLRERQDIFKKVQRQVNQRIELKIIKAQKQAEALSRRQQKLKFDKQLQALRKDFEERQGQKRRQQAQQEAKKKQQQKKKQAIRQLYLDDLSKKASQIQQVKTEKQKQEEEAKNRKKQQEQLARKKQLEENKPKVSYRQSIERKKIQKKIEEKQYREKFKAHQQERIKETVQGYSFRPNIEPSQERLNAPTAALLRKKEVKFDKADKIPLSKVDGYTVDQLMTDMRFRLNVALQDAGLSNAKYARQMLVGMSKRPNP